MISKREFRLRQDPETYSYVRIGSPRRVVSARLAKLAGSFPDDVCPCPRACIFVRKSFLLPRIYTRPTPRSASETTRGLPGVEFQNASRRDPTTRSLISRKEDAGRHSSDSRRARCAGYLERRRSSLESSRETRAPSGVVVRFAVVYQ